MIDGAAYLIDVDRLRAEKLVNRRCCNPKPVEFAMTKIIYTVIEHDGGWAYKVDDTISETFPSHELAAHAAKRAAAHQRLSGTEEAIDYEDGDGRWHEELARGDDRPDTAVEG